MSISSWNGASVRNDNAATSSTKAKGDAQVGGIGILIGREGMDRATAVFDAHICESTDAENGERESQTGRVNRLAQLLTEICCERGFATLTSWSKRPGILSGRVTEMLGKVKEGAGNEGKPKLEQHWKQLYSLMPNPRVSEDRTGSKGPDMQRAPQGYTVPSQIDRIGTRVQESCNVATCSSS